MRVLVYTTFALNTPHFETELELIQDHLDRGDEVAVVPCNAELLTCDVNWEHRLYACVSCIGRRRHGLSLLRGAVEALPQIALRPGQRAELEAWATRFESEPDLHDLVFDEFDVGSGVLSSLISRRREPMVDLAADRTSSYRLFVSALGTYRTLQNHLEERRFDRVYVYNGRYALMRAVLRACQSRGVDCFTHERGSTQQRYGQWLNSTVHDLQRMPDTMRAVWEAAPDTAERDRLAHDFFLSREAGVSHSWVSMTAGQVPATLPEGWRGDRRNVAIFVSSEDEFASVSKEWNNPLYRSQHDGIERIVNSAADDPTLHFYLRVHPNLNGVVNSQTRQLDTLGAPNLTIIPAGSTVSSYALLRASSVVVTFGSTVGVEASYWGVPSILAGQALYRTLDVTYNPRDHEELMELLRSELAPKDRLGALIFGYYWHTFGTEFKQFEPDGLFMGRFRGHVVRPERWARVLRRALQKLRLDPALTRLNLRRSARVLGVPSDPE